MLQGTKDEYHSTDSGKNYVATTKAFLTAKECQALIKWSEQKVGYTRQKDRVSKKKVSYVLTDKQIEWLMDTYKIDKRVEDIMEQVTDGLIGFTNPQVNTKTIQFMKYDKPGQYTKRHQDLPISIEDRIEGTTRKAAVIIYLSNDYDGGRTIFSSPNELNRLTIEPEQGMALIFNPRMIHESERLKSGKKYILVLDIHDDNSCINCECGCTF